MSGSKNDTYGQTLLSVTSGGGNGGGKGRKGRIGGQGPGGLRSWTLAV